MSQMVFQKAKWYERDERFLFAHHHTALLMDLMLARDVNAHKLLKGTGLFYEDILTGHSKIAPEQLILLIEISEAISTDKDVSFRWGSNLWPGHYGEFSQLLNSASNLREALKYLSQYRKQLCPLLAPKIVNDERYCYVLWQDTVGLDTQSQFMVEAYMSGLSSMVNWLSNQNYPWRYCFNYDRPQHDAEYEVNLGPNLHFSLGINGMIIENSYLDKPWKNHTSHSAKRVLEQNCERSIDYPIAGFIESVSEYLMANIRTQISLDQTANAFSMSSATFKRKLKKHKWSFQKLQDQARLEVSLYLFHVKGWTNDQVADYLNFNDLTNFRRAFKRWSGITPSDSRAMFSLT